MATMPSTLRQMADAYPVTAIPTYNIPLRAFAAAGFATCTRDTATDSYASFRGFNGPRLRQNKGSLAESVHFAKYRYVWNQTNFILFTVLNVQYVLIERRGEEDVLGPSKVVDQLIQTVGDWLLSDQEVVWVYVSPPSSAFVSIRCIDSWRSIAGQILAKEQGSIPRGDESDMGQSHTRRKAEEGPHQCHQEVLRLQASLRRSWGPVEERIAVPLVSKKYLCT